MRIGLLITVLVYGFIYYFVGKAKMPTYGDYLNQKNAVGSPGQSYQRARTTVNTTQIKSAPVKPKEQQTAATRLPKPINLNNSFGMGKEKDDYISDEKRKKAGSFIDRVGKNKEIDCDLDERVFGTKHQHKDVF